MALRFEWDGRKASANLGKNGLSFEEAATAFADPLSLAAADPDHSAEEDRFVLPGMSYPNKILVVVQTERGDNIRITSARRARTRERAQYEQPQPDEGRRDRRRGRPF